MKLVSRAGDYAISVVQNCNVPLDRPRVKIMKQMDLHKTKCRYQPIKEMKKDIDKKSTPYGT